MYSIRLEAEHERRQRDGKYEGEEEVHDEVNHHQSLVEA